MPAGVLAFHEETSSVNPKAVAYDGEVQVPLINLGPADFVIERGMRIAQMIITALPAVPIVEVEQLDQTPRGKGGFGHTGH